MIIEVLFVPDPGECFYFFPLEDKKVDAKPGHPILRIPFIPWHPSDVPSNRGLDTFCIVIAERIYALMDCANLSQGRDSCYWLRPPGDSIVLGSPYGCPPRETEMKKKILLVFKGPSEMFEGYRDLKRGEDLEFPLDPFRMSYALAMVGIDFQPSTSLVPEFYEGNLSFFSNELIALYPGTKEKLQEEEFYADLHDVESSTENGPEGNPSVFGGSC